MRKERKNEKDKEEKMRKKENKYKQGLGLLDYRKY